MESQPDAKQETPSTASTVHSTQDSHPCSSSSVPTGSSAETQPYASQQDEDTNQHPAYWGELHEVGTQVVHQLLKDSYTIGRGSQCDIILANAGNNSLYNAYSKIHFRIFKDIRSTGTYIFIEDLSGNGTIIGGHMIGKGKKELLKPFVRISLVREYNKVFSFLSNSFEENKEGIPDSVLNKYMFIDDIGRGAWGCVKMVMTRASHYNENSELYACKVIDKEAYIDGTSAVESRDVLKEAVIMKNLSNPGVVKVENVIDTPTKLFIIMEYVAGGDLFSFVRTEQRLSESHAKSLFYQLCVAVKYLHDKSVVHRDLKPENILLSSAVPHNQLVKITDFGLSKLLDSASKLKTQCGTHYYMAPEILLANSGQTYTKAVDCWSLGVILYVCLTGQPAFSPERRDQQLNDQILNGNVIYRTKHWAHIPEALDLVKKLITVQVDDRFTVDQALQHNWLADVQMRSKVDPLIGRVVMDGSTGLDDNSSCNTPQPKRRRLEQITENRAEAPTPHVPSNLRLMELDSEASTRSVNSNFTG